MSLISYLVHNRHKMNLLRILMDPTGGCMIQKSKLEISCSFKPSPVDGFFLYNTCSNVLYLAELNPPSGIFYCSVCNSPCPQSRIGDTVKSATIYK